MGIYIIRSRYFAWIKLGHHKPTKNKPSVYHRYIRRGFYSCLHPKELDQHLSFGDLELLHWFPNLTIQDERKLHKLFKRKYEYVGEWYRQSHIDEIVKMILEYGGIRQMPALEDLTGAMEWARRFKPLHG